MLREPRWDFFHFLSLAVFVDLLSSCDEQAVLLQLAMRHTGLFRVLTFRVQSIYIANIHPISSRPR